MNVKGRTHVSLDFLELRLFLKVLHASCQQTIYHSTFNKNQRMTASSTCFVRCILRGICRRNLLVNKKKTPKRVISRITRNISLSCSPPSPSYKKGFHKEEKKKSSSTHAPNPILIIRYLLRYSTQIFHNWYVRV